MHLFDYKFGAAYADYAIPHRLCILHIMSQDNIEGKVIVITGASSGLGEGAARELAKRGATIVVGARRLDRLKALVHELGQPEKAAVKVDVTNRNDVETLVQTAIDLYGRVDVLLNNAGIMPLSFLEKGFVEEWDAMIDVNIKGVLYGVNAVIPHFKQQKSGQIINVSSVSGHVVAPGSAVYSGTKFAVRAISEGLRQELKPYNIRVLNVSPGATQSDLVSTIKDEDVLGMFASSGLVPVPTTAFTDAIIYAIGQPENVDVNEVIFRPTAQIP